MKTKVCCRCKQEKPADQYYKLTGPRTNKDGLFSSCKPCCAEAKKLNKALKKERDARVSDFISKGEMTEEQYAAWDRELKKKQFEKARAESIGNNRWEIAARNNAKPLVVRRRTATPSKGYCLHVGC